MRVFIGVILLYLNIFACSIFDKKLDNGTVLVGRNFDWSGSDGKVAFYPATKHTFGMMLISQDNPDMPYEGMNDRGLFIAITAVPYSPTFYNVLKPARKSLSMVKEVLLRSASIDEAVGVFEKFAVNFGQFLGNPLVHFKLVQSDGTTAIIEFVNDEMRVVREPKVCTIMTNHYNSQKNITPNSKDTFERYGIIQEKIGGVGSVAQVFETLQAVAVEDTLWSNVYDLTHQIAYLKLRNHEVIKVSLKDALYTHQQPYFQTFSNFHEDSKPIESKSALLIRPQFGIGSDGLAHIGGRVLLATNAFQKFGIELTNFQNSTQNFTAVGIMLEQRLWSWFNMSMGTVGYIGYGDSKENTFGFSTNLGWEPDNDIPFLPFVTYRTDMVFATEKMEILHSVSIGFGF